MNKLNGVDSFTGRYAGGEGESPVDDLTSEMMFSKPEKPMDEFELANHNKPDPMMQLMMSLMGGRGV